MTHIRREKGDLTRMVRPPVVGRPFAPSAQGEATKLALVVLVQTVAELGVKV